MKIITKGIRKDRIPGLSFVSFLMGVVLNEGFYEIYQ